jgi:4'-phosphopantetheinyl transferase
MEKQMKTLWEEPGQGAMQVSPGEIHLWRIPLRKGFVCPDTLDGQEHIRAAQFLSEQARQRFIASHFALRDILARYLQVSAPSICIEQQEWKKPFLAESAAARAVSFSLSRSSDLSLIALTGGLQVGIDVECLHPDRYEQGMEELIFTEAEKVALAAVDPAMKWRKFLCGWTRKEAFAKCIGLGLAADLTHIELGLTEESACVQGITVRSFQPQDGFLAAWAAEAELRPTFWNWSCPSDLADVNT